MSNPQRPKGWYVAQTEVTPGLYTHAEMVPDIEGGWYSSEDADPYMDHVEADLERTLDYAQALEAENRKLRERMNGGDTYTIGLQRLIESLANGCAIKDDGIEGTHMFDLALRVRARLTEAERLLQRARKWMANNPSYADSGRDEVINDLDAFLIGVSAKTEEGEAKLLLREMVDGFSGVAEEEDLYKARAFLKRLEDRDV